jgi:hypothetical protein
MIRTNAYSVLCVFTRTFALWLFVSTVFSFPQLFISANEYVRSDQWIVVALVSNLFLVAVAGGLWIYADKLAKLALARPQQIVFESDISVLEWQALAFSIVGLWQSVIAVVYLTQRFFVIFDRYAEPAANSRHADLSTDFIGWLISECIRLIIGLALLFGSRGLAGLIRRYRVAGYPHSAAIDPSDSIEADTAKPDPTPPV